MMNSLFFLCPQDQDRGVRLSYFQIIFLLKISDHILYTYDAIKTSCLVIMKKTRYHNEKVNYFLYVISEGELI